MVGMGSVVVCFKMLVLYGDAQCVVMGPHAYAHCVYDMCALTMPINNILLVLCYDICCDIWWGDDAHAW